MEIYILSFISIVILFTIVSYWFSSIASRVREFFNTDEVANNTGVAKQVISSCNKTIECNINFINDRIKDAHIWIPYLEENITKIESSLPSEEDLVEEFYATDDNNRVILSMEKIENIYKGIYFKQSKIRDMLEKLGRTIKFDSRKSINDVSCFQLKSPDECASKKNELKNLIEGFYAKLDEISYRTNRVYKKVDTVIKKSIKMEKQKQKVINKTAKQVDKDLSTLFGFNVSAGSADYFKKGVDDKTKASFNKAITNGDMSDIRKMTETPEIQSMVKQLDRNRILSNLDGQSKFDDGQKYTQDPKKLFNDSLNDPEDDEETKQNALEAKTKMDENLDEIELPKDFKKYVKP